MTGIEQIAFAVGEDNPSPFPSPGPALNAFGVLIFGPQSSGQIHIFFTVIAIVIVVSYG